jgi:hypothetical protein
MKNIINILILTFGISFLFTGCYTIVNLSEASYDDYVSTPDEILFPPAPTPPTGGPIPRPPRPPIVLPIIIQQPIVVTNPPPDENRKKDVQILRNSGNGRDNTDRKVGSRNSNLTEIHNSTQGSSDSGRRR